ncbi:addiction module toxin, HicA family [Sphingomonas koreensis]|nr:addiction module toxin, HicA family [Sphingomonas koreensis]
MPRLPILSGDDVVKALERLGFEQRRQRGSHVVLRRGSLGCVVPLHKEVKAGTLAGILRQAGLTTDEFIDSLK